MMAKFLSILIFIFLYSGRYSVTALLDKTGQEIIEIRNPLKDLPTELEEEPSVEKDDVTYHGNTITSTTQQTHTKKDIKPKSDLANRRLIQKAKAQDDEARIEKELAEMYKDSDYKTDVDAPSFYKPNVTIDNATDVSEDNLSKEELGTKNIERSDQATVANKMVARAKEFKFQPEDINNKAEVERFRTSMDDIVCDRQFTTEKMSGIINAAGDDDKKSSAPTYDPEIMLFLTIPVIARMTNY